jgi:NAD(P)H-hydrate epimerase
VHLVQRHDVRSWVPDRPPDTNKWRAAVWVIAGSGGMVGAAHLAARAAQRAGAGMVRLSSPGVAADPLAPTEAVRQPLGVPYWAAEALGQVERFHAAVVGPGLGRADGTVASVREFVARAPVPLVVDADALFALAWGPDGALPLLRGRPAPTVLTPHDGEFALLRGGRVPPDRIDAARAYATASGCVVLLKGSTTVVADPGGHVALVTAGDRRLATAGTGDVLAGIIGALLAQRVPATPAAAAGAWLHGTAARRGPARGFVAGDLPDLLPPVLGEL